MQYVDIEPFEKYVRDRNLVNERHISYYLYWVRRFLQLELDRDTLSNSDLLQCFSDQLARDTSVEDWQVRQAMKAVELYLNVFLEKERHEALDTGHAGRATATPASLDSVPEGTRRERRETDAAEQEALERMRELMRLRHYSPRTEKTYLDWVGRYFRYARMNGQEWELADTVRAYLSYLATQRDVAASTQNQAFSSVLFLFRETLKIDIPEMNAVRAKRGPRLPVVLSPEETLRVLAKAGGTVGLMLKLTYGAGLRVSETVRLRVQDLDFGNETLFVRSGKGDKDRATVLPATLVGQLQEHLERVEVLHREDLADGFGAVYLPHALERK